MKNPNVGNKNPKINEREREVDLRKIGEIFIREREKRTLVKSSLSATAKGITSHGDWLSWQTCV